VVGGNRDTKPLEERIPLRGDARQVVGPALAGGLFLVSTWIAPIVCAATALVAAVFSLPQGGSSEVEHVVQPMPRLVGNRSLIILLGIALLFGGATGSSRWAFPPSLRVGITEDWVGCCSGRSRWEAFSVLRGVA
jgi:hypothetical protein